MSISVPVIDFAKFSLSRTARPSQDDLMDISKQMGTALENYRCFWIENTGVDINQLRDLCKRTVEFYSLPLKKKLEYVNEKNVKLPTGYFPDSQMKTVKDINDVGKQGFHYCPMQENCILPADNVAPGMIKTFDAIWNGLIDVSMRVAEGIALGLGLDPDKFIQDVLKGLKNRDMEQNWATVRVNHYEPVTQYKDGALRFSAHSDWTLFTLLYATTDGLMSEVTPGEWLSVGHREDAILVQTGFILDTLTKGKVQPNRHRVDIPSTPEGRATARQSVACFIYPDNDILLAPLDEQETAKKDGDIKTTGESLEYLLREYISSGDADHEKDQ